MTQDRRLISAISLVVMAAATLVMALWGYHALTAPFSHDPAETPMAGAECTPGSGSAGVVRRRDVTVSVFNSGQRAGRAQETLDLFEKAGFKPGAIGNAPDGVSAARAEVRTTKQDDPAARLVARTLGRRTKVVVGTEDYGPGVDVVIGDKFRKLDATAPTQIRITAAQGTCP